MRATGWVRDLSPAAAGSRPSLARGDRGRGAQSAVIGHLLDVLGRAPSVRADGQDVEQHFIPGTVAAVTRTRAFAQS